MRIEMKRGGIKIEEWKWLNVLKSMINCDSSMNSGNFIRTMTQTFDWWKIVLCRRWEEKNGIKCKRTLLGCLSSIHILRSEHDDIQYKQSSCYNHNSMWLHVKYVVVFAPRNPNNYKMRYWSVSKYEILKHPNRKMHTKYQLIYY